MRAWVGGCPRAAGGAGALDRPDSADVPGVFAILGDPRTVEHNPSELLTDEADAAEVVGMWIRHWDEHGFGYWWNSRFAVGCGAGLGTA